MPKMPSQSALEQMIATAMQDRAPGMYRDLRSEGRLQAVLTDRAQMAIESYRTATEAAMQPDELDASQLAASQSAAMGTAIAQAVEFPPEDEPDRMRTPGEA